MNKEEFEALFSINEYLLKLVPGLELIVDESRSRDFRSINDLVDAMDGIVWLMKAFTSIEACTINVDIEFINENMSAITDALQEKDYTLLADVLEYEIIPLVSAWLKELEDILRSGNYSS